MIPYGKTKRRAKLHPHNECSVCSEQGWTKATARQANKRVIEEELRLTEKWASPCDACSTKECSECVVYRHFAVIEPFESKRGVE